MKFFTSIDGENVVKEFWKLSGAALDLQKIAFFAQFRRQFA